MNDISVTSDWNSFKHSSLDSSHRGGSNGSCFISNGSILTEIKSFKKMSGRVVSDDWPDPRFSGQPDGYPTLPDPIRSSTQKSLCCNRRPHGRRLCKTFVMNVQVKCFLSLSQRNPVIFFISAQVAFQSMSFVIMLSLMDLRSVHSVHVWVWNREPRNFRSFCSMGMWK